MIVILLLIIIAVTFALYMLGYIPGTDKYILRVTKLNLLEDMDINDINDICRVYNQLDFDEIKATEDKQYLTFTGMKTVAEIVNDDEKLESLEKGKVCQDIKDKKIIDEDAFLTKMKEIGVSDDNPTKNCSAYINLGLRGVIREGKLLLDEDALKDHYPKFANNVGRCSE
jgi:hypothetical protein